MVSLALSLVGCKPEPLDDSLYPADQISLSLFDPAPGAMVHDGPATVRGEVKGLTDVEVNGVRARVDGNLWEVDLELARGINTFEVGGVDGTGHRVFVRQSVLAGEFGGTGQPLDEALGVRINSGGLNATGDLVSGLVDPYQISALLPSINPVYQDSYGVFGIDAVEITAELQSLWFSPPQLTLDPGAGAVQIRVVLPDLYVVVPVYGQAIGIDFDEDVTLTADAAVIDGFLELGTKNGALKADLVAPSVQLQGFYFDTTLLPGGIEDSLLSDTIQGVLEDVLVDQISTLVPDLLDEQLSTLKIEFTTELFGKGLQLGADFDRVTIDQDGIELVANLDVVVEGPYVKETSGWLLAPDADVRPATGPDLAVELSDDVVNRLLHDAWRSGMLDLTLTTADGSLDPLLLIPLGGKTEGTIAVDADLPPVLVQADGEAALQLGELNVTIDTPGGDNGEHLEVTVSGQIPIDLELQDSALKLGLGDPQLAFMVRDSDWGMSDETLTNVLSEQLPVDTLLALLGDIAIPVPSIYGLTLPDASIGRDGEGTATTIDLNL